jgi:hypothetical protein
MFEAGFVDISRNDEIDGQAIFGIDEHTLLGTQAAGEKAVRVVLKKASLLTAHLT